MKLRLVFFLGLVWLLLFLASPAVQARSLTLTPNSGPVGTEVKLSGEIIYPDGYFIVYWQSTTGLKLSEGKAKLFTAQASFTVPEAPGGAHPVLLYDKEDRTSVAQAFTVTPSLKPGSGSGSPLSSLEISGQGFGAHDILKISLGNIELKKNVSASGLGSFKTSITLPETTVGSHKLTASGKYRAEINFFIHPSLSLPPDAEVGKEVVLSGYGFAPNSRITLRHEGNPLASQPENVISNAKGSFSCTIVLPQGTTLEPELEGKDALGNKATLKIPLETKAPSPPEPLSPKGIVNLFGSSQVKFEWKEVTDPSGVSYQLEVARSITFFPPYLKRSGITATEHTETLPQGTYYWRLRAVDGAGNASPWAVAPHPFTVGYLPLWLPFLLGFICLIIISRLFRRRPRYPKARTIDL